jgi:hypothetical protein
METLREAIDRLERAGFREAFRARPEGFLEVGAERIYAPETLIVDEIVRFEGESDPEDEAVVFALRSRDGSVRGTFVATYGPSADPVSGELIRRLDTGHRHGNREAESGSRPPRAPSFTRPSGPCLEPD